MAAMKARTRTGSVTLLDPQPAVARMLDLLCVDEMFSMVELALRGAEHADREAFILHALEGFSVDEIADIIECKPEEVRASIASAREHLRKSPPIANQFRDKLLEKTGSVS